jgi:hypothetical protein
MIRDPCWELQANRNLLAALAGPGTSVTLDAVGGALPVRQTREDLTRILVNLVRPRSQTSLPADRSDRYDSTVNSAA